MSTATTPDSPASTESKRSLVQLAALAFGIVFVLVGIAGFIPGVTTNVDSLKLAGHHSDAHLLGIFQVSILHNIVHLLYGVAGLALARAARSARLYLLIGGIVYLVLWIYGLLVGGDSAANFVPLNTADNWLHLFLGVAMIGSSFLPGADRVHDHQASRATA